jgi:phosphate transport system protein
MRIAASTNNFRIDGVMLQIELMVQQVINQLTSVLESYERRDVSKALEVWRKDRDLDALNDSLFRTLLTHMMEDPRCLSSCASSSILRQEYRANGRSDYQHRGGNLLYD